MKRTLDIAIDESGDFGGYQMHSPYYFIAMLFHDTKNDINEASKLLDSQIINLGYDIHAIHTGPIIRREDRYKNFNIDERKKLLNALIHFNRRVNVMYNVLYIEKKECADIIDVITKLSKKIHVFIKKHEDFFHQFDKINVYYDNGQIELTRILTSTLSVLLPNVIFHRVKPFEYKLSQLIDMYCSLELTALKFDKNTPSQSELEVFYNYRTFKKDYLNKIRKKRLE
ncbi:MAG: hypothetical protein FWD38_11740 [Oscillospiraceae bacterium]|nr:hypothetical protein [Oscillospiraceae bacterium]